MDKEIDSHLRKIFYHGYRDKLILPNSFTSWKTLYALVFLSLQWVAFLILAYAGIIHW